MVYMEDRKWNEIEDWHDPSIGCGEGYKLFEGLIKVHMKKDCSFYIRWIILN